MNDVGESQSDLRYDDMAWSVPEFAKKKVDKAARTILIDPGNLDENGITLHEYFSALGIVNNWRSSHAFPLNTFQNGLRHRARALDEHAIIAQRIKRMSSIEAKLRRFPTMTLSQMQDIGGCRAILSKAADVERLCSAYADSQLKHKLHHVDNYVKTPKKSGYRGIHLIYRYHSDKKNDYNSLLIEIQIRSQMQHAWATAVEVFGAFVNQALKSSIGKQEYLRFFSLMGSAMAYREKTALVPDTPDIYKSLIIELRSSEKKLEIGKKLAAFGTAVKMVDERHSGDDHFYLVIVNHKDRVVSVKGFPHSASKEASAAYLDAEKEILTKPHLDAVLVSVESIAALQRAYPNYFLDTRLFRQILAETVRTTSIPKKIVKGGQLPLL